MTMATIPDEHIKKVCKPGEIDCCRYLIVSSNGFECAKGDSHFKALLDMRVANKTIRAVGDNCDGIAVLDES